MKFTSTGSAVPGVDWLPLLPSTENHTHNSHLSSPPFLPPLQVHFLLSHPVPQDQHLQSETIYIYVRMNTVHYFTVLSLLLTLIGQMGLCKKLKEVNLDDKLENENVKYEIHCTVVHTYVCSYSIPSDVLCIIITCTALPYIHSMNTYVCAYVCTHMAIHTVHQIIIRFDTIPT